MRFELVLLFLLVSMMLSAQGYFKTFGTVDDELYAPVMQDHHDTALEELLTFNRRPGHQLGDSLATNHVYRLDEWGNIVDSVQYDEGMRSIIATFSAPDDELVLFFVWSSFSTAEGRLLIRRINSSFEPIEERSYHLPDSVIAPWFQSGIINEAEEFVLCGSALYIYGPNDIGKRLLHFKISNTLDSLSLLEIEGPESQSATSKDLVQLPNGNYALVTFGWFENYVPEPGVYSDVYLTTLDSNLIPIYTYEPVDGLHDPDAGIQMYQDSLILCVAGTRQGIASPLTRDFCVIKFDTEYQVVDSVVLGIGYDGENLEDKVHPRTLAQYPNGDILVGSSYNWLPGIGEPYNHNYRWIQLYRLDSDLNVIWRKFYGGDKCYYLREVRAMSNGDVMALGGVYDFEASPDDKNVDLFVLRANGDGEITGLMENGMEVVNFKLSPNPASTMCSIQTSLSQYDMRLYALDGSLVLSKEGLSGDVTLDVSMLTSGQYVLHVEAVQSRLKISERLIIE